MSLSARLAIIDYGLGNLFSIQHACLAAGGRPAVTADPREILEADALLLPGMGAFGDAMTALHARDLVAVIRDYAASGRPVIGICLGMQLFMRESFEFGRHAGLGLIDGDVVRFEGLTPLGGRAPKVPQIGWNAISEVRPGAWAGTLLDGVRSGTCMYFVHSYYVRPADPALWLARAVYGGREFCAALAYGNLMATQFHPERSGPAGLTFYRNLLSAARGAAVKECFRGSV